MLSDIIKAMKKIVIDGNNFSTYSGFILELSKQLGDDESGYGLDWLDDILYGGIVYFDDDEKVQFIWKNSSKSRYDLNKDLSHPLPKEDQGKLFEFIIGLIRHHDNIQLQLED